MKKVWYLVALLSIALSVQSMKRPETDIPSCETKQIKQEQNVHAIRERLLNDITPPTITPQDGIIAIISGENQEFTLSRTAAQLADTLYQSFSSIDLDHPIQLSTLNNKQLSFITQALTAITSLPVTTNYKQILAETLDALLQNPSLLYLIELLTVANYLYIPLLIK